MSQTSPNRRALLPTGKREVGSFDICPAGKTLTSTGRLVNDGETLIYMASPPRLPKNAYYERHRQSAEEGSPCPV